MKLYHSKKGVLSPSGKKFSPLKGVVPLYADEKGQKYELDGTEVPLDHILKSHKQSKEQEQEQESEQEQKTQEVQDEMDFEQNLSEQDKKEAQDEEEMLRHKDILSEIKEASEAIVEAVEAIPEAVIPEFPDHYKEQAVWQEKVLEALKLEFPETDMTPVVKAIKEIKFPELPKPIDYMEALVEIKNALPKEKDNSDVVEAIGKIKFPSLPNFEFNKEGRLKVEVDRISLGGGSGGNGLATEETLQKIAGMNYDNVSVDTTNPSSIVITKKMGSTIVDTKTINII